MADRLTCQCVVVGGGPAGVMAGYLLARAGVDVVVLEKHADFFRDFRGDTVHPSTLRVMDELGLLAEFLQRPHQKLGVMEGRFGDTKIRLADMSRLKVVAPYIAFMPQWDFLDFLSGKGRLLKTFRLMMQFEVTGLLGTQDRYTGVKVKTPQGERDVCADLIIGADGRHSLVRAAAGLKVEDIGAPIDVLWFRVSRDPATSDDMFARIQNGHMLVTLDRGDYWQCAYVIAKGGMENIKAQGIEKFRATVAATAPEMNLKMDEIKSFDDVRLLTVTVDRMPRWTRPGLLCIGDAAHAMSPVGGVGINLAIQDAVAAANILASPLLQGTVTEGDCDRVRRSRLFPAKVVQAIQVQVQNRLLSPIVSGKQANKPPLFLRLVNASPWLQGLVARLIGLGIVPEHVKPVGERSGLGSR